MKLAKLFPVVVLVMLVLGACAPVEPTPTSIAVQIPSDIALAIEIGVTALLTAGAAFVFAKIGLDLRGFAVPLSMTIALWIVGELQNIINTIPETYDPTLNLVLKIIVLVLGSLGILYLRKPEAPSQGLLSK